MFEESSLQVVSGEVGLVDQVGLAGKTSKALAGAHGERVAGPEGGARPEGLDMTAFWARRGAVAPCGTETVKHSWSPRNGRRRKAARILWAWAGGAMLSSQLPWAIHLEFAKARFSIKQP